MIYWKKLSQEERKNRIERALDENVNFSKDASLGYPASKLDGKVFYDDAPFLQDAPTLKTYVAAILWELPKRLLKGLRKWNERF